MRERRRATHKLYDGHQPHCSYTHLCSHTAIFGALTTVLIQNRSIVNIHLSAEVFINAESFNYFSNLVCLPGAKVPDILAKLPGLLQTALASIQRVIVHVRINDTATQQSKLTKLDFVQLFNLLKNT